VFSVTFSYNGTTQICMLLSCLSVKFDELCRNIVGVVKALIGRSEKVGSILDTYDSKCMACVRVLLMTC